MRTISILALDTASPSPAVTLLVGETAFDEPLPSDRHASEHLLAGIESCFSRAGLSLSDCARIAVCAGPGSFTGVRVGLATAWGLGRALDCPVESVSTLEAMAEAARAPGRLRLAAALDAGRQEIVWQAFDMTGARAIPLAPAARVFVSDAAFGGLPYVSAPPDLAGPGSVPLEGPVSRALALAVGRRPADGSAKSFAAIYSRPSAAEEKRGAPYPSPTTYAVAPARVEDLDEIARIERESFLVPWKQEFFAAELDEPYRYARVLVGGRDSEPRVGGYLFAVSLYEEFHINKIATDPRLRNQGHGRRLLEDALARARSVGATAVTLEVRLSNLPAREFYRSYGFREAYRRKSYYQDGEDAFAMVLTLGS